MKSIERSERWSSQQTWGRVEWLRCLLRWVSPAILASSLFLGTALASDQDVVSPLLKKLVAKEVAVRRAAALDLGTKGRGKSDDPAWAPAITALIAACADGEATVRRNALVALIEIGPARADCRTTFIAALSDSDPFVRHEGIRGVGHAGAVDALPRLVEIARGTDHALRPTVIEALFRMGTPAVDALFDLLVDATPELEQHVLDAVEHLEVGALPMLRGMLAQALDPDLALTDRAKTPLRVAIAAVESLGPLAAPLLPDLFALRASPNAETASAAMIAITEIESRPRHCIEQWISIANDTRISPKTRAAACDALGKLGFLADEAMPVLRQLVVDAENTPLPVRVAAGQAISRIGTKKLPMSDLVPLLSAENADSQLMVAVTLAIGVDSDAVERARGRLHTLVADPKSAVDLQVAILRTLGFVAKPDGREFQVLLRAAEGADRTVARAAIESLTRLAEQLENGHVTTLCALAKHRDAEVRCAIATCLGQVKVVVNAVTTLGKLAADPEGSVRITAVSALSNFCGRSGDALKRIVKALDDPDPDVRYSAVMAIPSSSQDARSIVTQLAKRLDDDTSYVRWGIAWKLGALGSDAKAAIPALLKLTNEESREVRAYALVALRQIDPGAKRDFDSLVIDILASGDSRAQNLTLQYFSLLTELSAKQPGTAIPASTQELVRAAGSCLRSVHEETRVTAASALKSIGPHAIVALDAVIGAAQDPAEEVRTAAIEILREFVREERARNAITAALDDSDAPTRAMACRAIAYFGNWSAELKARMRALSTQDPNLEVRQIATSVIKVFET